MSPLEKVAPEGAGQRAEVCGLDPNVELSRRPPSPDQLALVDLDQQVAAALHAALAPNTWRAYAADWRHWSTWAAGHQVPALPTEPLDLARYLVAHAGVLAVGTLTRRLSAVSKAHGLAGHLDPADDVAVREVQRGLRRQHGTAKRGAPPLWTSDIERIVAGTLAVPSPAGRGEGLAELRDRALLLLAFTTALRRSELAALDLADLEPDPAGLIVHVRRSKTDQSGEGSYIGSRTPRGRRCAPSGPPRPGQARSQPSSSRPASSCRARCSARSTDTIGSARSAPARVALTPGCHRTPSEPHSSGGPPQPA